MIDINEIVAMAEQVKNYFTPLKPLGKLVSRNGLFYPVEKGKMLNPLDAYNLIGCCGREDVLDMFFRTLEEAEKFKDMGYSILTRLNSGAPRVIQIGGDNGDVFILGDVARRKSLYYPLFTALLSDDKWDFDSMWSTYGYKRPTMPVFTVTRNSCRKLYTLETTVESSYTLGDYRLVFSNIEDSDGFRTRTARWVHENVPIDRPNHVWDDDVKDF